MVKREKIFYLLSSARQKMGIRWFTEILEFLGYLRFKSCKIRKKKEK